MTYTDIQEMCILLGINIIIIDTNTKESIWYASYPNEHTICLALTGSHS